MQSKIRILSILVVLLITAHQDLRSAVAKPRVSDSPKKEKISTSPKKEKSSASTACPQTFLVGYWQNWTNGATPYIPLDQVDPRYNVVNLSFAIPGGGTDYDMTFDLCCGETEAGLIAKIQSVQANGVIVNISIGGANDPVHLDNTAELNAFVLSMNSIINTYGFDGLDIDLEGSSLSISGGTIANPIDTRVVNFINAIQQIAADYQSNFGKSMFLSAAPETAFVQGGQSAWGGIWGAYLPVLDALRDEMDLLHVQLYNSGSMYGIDGGIYAQSSADFIVSQVEAVIAGFNANGGGFFTGYPECKVAVGLPACPSGAGGGFTNTATVKAAIDYLMGNGPKPGSYTLQAGPYPDLGGMMTWSINWDAVSSCNASAYEYAANYEAIFPAGNMSCTQPDPGPDISACGLMFPYLLDSNTPTHADVNFSWTNLSTMEVLVSNSPSANSFSISGPGSYEVSRDSAGCVKVDIINVLEDLPMPALPASLDLCNTLPESISVSNAGIFPAGTSWVWYKDSILLENETTSSYTDIRSSGNYKLVASYLSCSSEANIVVSSALPEPVDGCGGVGDSTLLSINTMDAGPFNWYDTSTDGNLLNTGTSFTTPSLDSTTTYYVEVDAGGGVSSATTGPPATANSLGNLNNWIATSEISFDVENQITLTGFTVYPLIWCSVHTVTIEIRDASGTVLPNGAQSFSIDGGADCDAIMDTPVALTLSGGGVNLSPGSGYKIVSTGSIILNHWSGPAAYPMNYSPYFTITGGNNGSTYMAVHDWVVEGTGNSCSRLPVVATVDPACGIAGCESSLDLQGPIAGNSYHAADSISASGMVITGSIVDLRAGESILLEAGFEAELGCEFSAEIENCVGN